MSQAETAAKIEAQGNVVRELKAAKADKAAITAEARAVPVLRRFYFLPSG